MMDIHLHSVSLKARTPFLDLLNGSISYFLRGEEPSTPILMSNWLEDLQEASIDLEEYGRHELDLYQRGLVSWVLYGSKWAPDLGIWKETTWILTNFTYGPSPSDWSVCIEEMEDQPSEVRERRMPGGWFEESDIEGEDDEGEGEETLPEEDDELGKEDEESEVDEETHQEEAQQSEERE